MSDKKSIRIPFRKDENKRIVKNAEREHLKRATYVTALLLKEFTIFEKKNRHQVNMKFECEITATKEPVYIQIFIENEEYEKIKKISDITKISMPNLCRYLIIPGIREGE